MTTWFYKCAEQCPELFDSAEEFLSDYEKKYCALMERILQKESSVYVILKKDSSFGFPQVAGVFSFNRGRSFTACIPDYNSKIKKLLRDFFRTHEVFSIIGESEGVKKIEQILYEYKNLLPAEIREMFLMEYNGSVPAAVELKEQGEKIKRCSGEDAEKLMPLQVNFSCEEVYPFWKKEVNLAAERFALDSTLKKQMVFAVVKNNYPVSRAQTNARTKNYFQIGGVYTLKEYRGRGYACQLVKTIADAAALENKKTVLYVRKENAGALRSYVKAGFNQSAEYRMVYYR